MAGSPAVITVGGADPLGCDNTVELADGSVVSTWSPDWLAECLERHNDALFVLRMVTKEIRRDHVAKLAARRGAVYASRLEAEVLSIWHARRAAIAAAHE